MSKRAKLYYWFIGEVVGVPEGCIPPSWTKIVYGILFPIKFLFWVVHSKEGYQIQSNSWKIYGIDYSDYLFYRIAHSDGVIFKISKGSDDYVIIEKMYEEKKTS